MKKLTLLMVFVTTFLTKTAFGQLSVTPNDVQFSPYTGALLPHYVCANTQQQTLRSFTVTNQNADVYRITSVIGHIEGDTYNLSDLELLIDGSLVGSPIAATTGPLTWSLNNTILGYQTVNLLVQANVGAQYDTATFVLDSIFAFDGTTNQMISTGTGMINILDVATPCSQPLPYGLTLGVVKEFLGGDTLFGVWYGTAPDSIQVRLIDFNYNYTYRTLDAQLIAGTDSFFTVLKDSCNGNSIEPHKMLKSQAFGYWGANIVGSNMGQFQTSDYWAFYTNLQAGANSAWIAVKITGVTDSLQEIYGTADVYPTTTGGTTFHKDSILGFYYNDNGTPTYVFYIQAIGLTSSTNYGVSFSTCVGGINLGLWQTYHNQVTLNTTACGDVDKVETKLDSIWTVDDQSAFFGTQIIIPHSLAFSQFPVSATITNMATGAVVSAISYTLTDFNYSSQMLDTITSSFVFLHLACGTYKVSVEVFNPCGGLVNSNDVTFSISANCAEATISQLFASPGVVSCNGTSNVYWNTQNAASAQIEIQQHTGAPGVVIQVSPNSMLVTQPISDSLIVTLTATNAYGISTSETVVITANCATGISETSDEQTISLFPNPAISLLSVEHVPDGIENYTVISVTGDAVAKGKIERGTNLTLDVSNLAAGMYFLKLGKTIKKFAKQ